MDPPAAAEEDCPLCLDHLPFDPNEAERLYCCGHMVCSSCISDRDLTIEKERENGSWSGVAQLATRCPMCRTQLPGSDYEVLRRIRAASEEGKTWGTYELACAYLFGRLGVEKDDASGMELVTSAADQGFVSAQHHLGEIFDRGGHGVARSTAEAKRWYEAAAKNGRAHSRFNLACIYREEEDNIPEYLKHCKMAADAGFPAAGHNIGNAHFHGQFGLEKSVAMAIEYYTPAAKAGHHKAQNMLGNALMSKTGSALNNPEFPRAMRWIRTAAAAGNEESKQNLSRMEEAYCRTCFACFETNPRAPPLNRCTRCRSAWYCSKTCQKKNWTVHKCSCCRYDEVIVGKGKEKKDSFDGNPRSTAEAAESLLRHRTCSACMRPKVEDAYSKKQFKLAAKFRRCKDCIEAGRESKPGFVLDHVDTSNPNNPLVTVTHEHPVGAHFNREEFGSLIRNIAENGVDTSQNEVGQLVNMLGLSSAT